MKHLFEVIVSVGILLILTVFLNPTHLLMPDTVNTMLMLGLIIGFLGFMGLVWRERGGDEREAAHIQKSGRISFFVGASVLVLGVVMQATKHEVDPWLIYALAVMVLTKLITRIFQSIRN